MTDNKRDLVIVGSKGYGREILWLLQDVNRVENRWNILGFIDDDQERIGAKVDGYEVLGNVEWLKDKDYDVVIAISSPGIKQKIVSQLAGSLNRFPAVIHPSVIYSDSVRFGEGVLVCAGTILTIDIELEDFASINLACTVGHEARIKKYATIYPGVNISGNVVLEECVSIGTGAAVIQGLTIGKNATIGAGAVVVRDIPSDVTAVGVPAKVIG